MSEENIHLDGISITLYKSKKAKSINITIKPFKGVRVAIPWYSSYKQAKRFVKQREDWIKKHSFKMQQLENQRTIFDWDSQFKTRDHTLKISKVNSDLIKTVINNGMIQVNLPEYCAIQSEEIQEKIQKGIELAWRKEAKDYLPKRVSELAEKHGLIYNRVKINSAKTRWGSCSYDNNINLTLFLMRLPDDLVDYVILHELAHTKVKNHGPKFWNLLDQFTGNAKQIDKELKKYKIKIY